MYEQYEVVDIKIDDMWMTGIVIEYVAIGIKVIYTNANSNGDPTKMIASVIIDDMKNIKKLGSVARY